MSSTSSHDQTCQAPEEFTCGVRIGHVFIVQSATLSLVACVTLLSYIALNGLRNIIKPPNLGQQRWHFLRTPVDHYLLSLIIGDILMALGSIMHIRWISIAGLEDGLYCTTQAVMKQVGDIAVALSAMCIAAHTFLVLFLRCNWPQKRLVPLITLALLWIIIILVTVIPSQIHKDAPTPYYGKTVHWCSIDEQYTGERIGLLWAIFWFAALVNTLLYVPLFLFLRGNIVVKTNYVDQHNSQPRLMITWKRITSTNAWAQHRERREEAAVIARSMLAYPIVYVILITPLGVIRCIQLVEKRHPSGEEHSAANVVVPYAWTALAAVIFNSSGFVNVFLYTITRPSLFPWYKRFTQRSEAITYQEPDATKETFGSRALVTSSNSPHFHDYRVRPTSLPVPMLTEEDDDGGQVKVLDSSITPSLTSISQVIASRSSGDSSKVSRPGYQ